MDTARATAPIWPGRPHARHLVRDGVRTALVQRVSSIAGAFIVAIICVVVLATAGRSAANERAILSQVDSVGTRLLTLVDDKGEAGVTADGVLALAGVDAVDEAFGLGSAVDVRSVATPDGGAAARRALVGSLPEDLTLVSGRAPRPGEAVVGVTAARALGLADGLGAVALPRSGADETPVVGVVHGTGPLANLDELVLARPPAGAAPVPVRFVYVTARSVGDVPSLTTLLPELVRAENTSSLAVEAPSGAIALRDAISGQLGASSRQMMALVLGVGLVIVSVSTYGAVAGRRRDFGRRRALGASRSAIVVLVLVQTAVVACSGAALGVGVGLWATWSAAGSLPSVSFVTGVGVLAVLVALAGAVPPALAAALRDPVRILRVP
ncbi:hypothetical protein IGS67_07310 [Flavimobilis sp. GY10621]|uniref:ABC3 transporter permease C-terminal domain-containing protein n=1 Tax=Flavimobilis rhizosphaerae TaxID=2775421 RepID=A0ABR9DQN4_9MICO|nr:hypothetical protein [Flavimobilis rhizosphaerae]